VWLSGGKVRWRTIQIVLDAGYADGFRAKHPNDPGFTFPTWDPHVRLDYLFLPARYTPQLLSCELKDVPGAREASDHLPLLSVLRAPAVPLASGAVRSDDDVAVEGAPADLQP
jgi:exodeoxyribonuclease-3